MLGVNQLDFINYANALKGNYRKGVHKMETLLENPTHAKEFAKNLGGVSVVLGTPVGKEDRNSETLRSMLLASDVANDAVLTWMHQFYEFTDWDDLMGDAERCKAMMANELLWRALSASGVAMGKTVATLAGLSCSAYDDMSAVAASSTAMTAVASSQTAMTAVINNSTALNAVVSSSTAMAAVASSQTAMAAIFRSSTAMTAVQNNASAWAIFSNASSAVMGKTVAELAGLNPSGYADMNAIASSSTAMAAIIANSTALKAVVSSSAAMSAVAASQTAMAAIANNKTAITAVEASSAAKNALYNSPLKTTMSSVQSTSSWVTRRSGKIWLISFKQTWSSGSNTMQHRYTLKDNTTLSCTATQSYNTDYRIDRFMDSITNYNNAGGIGAACTYVFIPC